VVWQVVLIEDNASLAGLIECDEHGVGAAVET
jgi:hypothetical protein